MLISIFTLWLIIILFYCAIGTWKLFEKAGRKSWEGLVPVYNLFIWAKVINKPWWWGLILLIPGWNQLLMLGAMNVSMGRIFGKFSPKDTIMQILLPFIYFPMIAYDEKVQYQGETDWNNKEDREKRKISDQIALFFASFGIINVLVFVLKLTGSKDKPGQKTVVKEWGDSIVFALIAASIIRGYTLEAFTIPTPSMEKEMLVGDFLFVNKLAYGTRVPMTPISFPLAHNTIPFTYVNSYSTAIKLPYYRLPGFGKVERNDIVVFNYPTGDTTVLGRFPGAEGAGGEIQGHNYYEFVRREAYNFSRGDIRKFFSNKEKYEGMARTKILEDKMLYSFGVHGYATRPIDKRENYVKRCVAVAGDTLEIVDGVLKINGKFNNVGENVNFTYYTLFNRRPLDKEFLMFKENYGFNLQQYKDIEDPRPDPQTGQTTLPKGREAIINMSDNVKEAFVADINSGKYGDLRIDTIYKSIDKREDPVYSYISIYPNHEKFRWTVDNYGPLWMPKEGVTIPLNEDNWIKYNRCINTYENHNYKWVKGAVYDENNQKVENYTFQQDYYYMIGDNRHNSADSRMWGFVPADHIVGKTLIVFMSKDQEKGWFDGGVRWNRIFKTF